MTLSLHDKDDLSPSFIPFSLEFSSFVVSQFICISDFLSFRFLLSLSCPVSPVRVSRALLLFTFFLSRVSVCSLSLSLSLMSLPSLVHWHLVMSVYHVLYVLFHGHFCGAWLLVSVSVVFTVLLWYSLSHMHCVHCCSPCLVMCSWLQLCSHVSLLSLIALMFLYCHSCLPA